LLSVYRKISVHSKQPIISTMTCMRVSWPRELRIDTLFMVFKIRYTFFPTLKLPKTKYSRNYNDTIFKVIDQTLQLNRILRLLDEDDYLDYNYSSLYSSSKPTKSYRFLHSRFSTPGFDVNFIHFHPFPPKNVPHPEFKPYS